MLTILDNCLSFVMITVNNWSFKDLQYTSKYYYYNHIHLGKLQIQIRLFLEEQTDLFLEESDQGLY